MPDDYSEAEPASPAAAEKQPLVADPDAFMKKARERYEYALAADAEDRAAAEEDVDFVDGNQWSKQALKKRKKRPTLTWNRLQTFVAQIVNDGRENKPSIRTSAMDGGKPHTAEFFQNRIRHIEYESDADIAYDTAREHQVVSGRGFYRVTTEYKPKSRDQRARIEPIENQFSVLFEPTAKRYDRSDAEYAFVFSWLGIEAYERKFGNATEAARAGYFENGDNPAPDWVGVGPSGKNIQVAEYWCKEYEKRTVCILNDLTVVYAEELTAEQAGEINDSHEEDFCRVMQYIIDGIEVLDCTEFIVPFIPIVPVWGKQMVVKGKRKNYSLVRFAKDPQRLVNLYVSNIAEQVALMPKTPYIVAVGQILGREAEWEAINEDPKAVVQYNPKDVNGNPIAAPTRDVNEPPIQALTIGLNQSIDAIKAAMGIFDASLGSGPGDTSGIAIQKRQKESDVANFHFPDNEARSRKYLGRILLAMIPILDKGSKEVPTRDESGKVKLVKVGQKYTDDKTGSELSHNLADGTYEIAVATGPSYNSQRQQANDAYAQIAANDKNFMSIAGDLYFRTSDMPGADLIADRYEKMLPAQLQPQAPGGPQQAAQLQTQLNSLAAQHQALIGQIHQLSQVIEQKQIEAASRERIAAMQVWGSVRIQGMKNGNAAAIADSDREASRLEGIFDRSHEAAIAHMEAGQGTASQMAAQGHEQDMQQAAQLHQVGMQQNAPQPAPQQQAA